MARTPVGRLSGFLARLAGVVAGLFCGALFGLLVLILAIVFARSDFGLDSILPGALFGGAAGSIFGLVCPEAAMALIGKLFSV
jgi:hypothetical protein